MSSTFASGQWRATSSGPTISTGIPKPCANSASRVTVSRRSGVVARCRCPIVRNPVSCPVTAVSVGSSAVV